MNEASRPDRRPTQDNTDSGESIRSACREAPASFRGFPDLVLVRERVLFVELKTETGRLTRPQADWLEALARAWADVHLWRPSDWDSVAEALR